MEKKEVTQDNSIATNLKILDLCAKKLKKLSTNFEPLPKGRMIGYSLMNDPIGSDDTYWDPFNKKDSIDSYVKHAKESIDLLLEQKDDLTYTQFHTIQNRIREITEYAITTRRLKPATDFTLTISSGNLEGPTSPMKDREKIVESLLVGIFTGYNKERKAFYDAKDRHHNFSDHDLFLHSLQNHQS